MRPSKLTSAPGLLGALVAAHEPRNGVGWWMCIGSLAAVLLYLSVDYGYVAVVSHHGSWPLGGAAVWPAAWVWAPVMGLFLPMLTIRFPRGQMPRRWLPIDWLAIRRTIAVALSIAIGPRGQLGAYLPLTLEVLGLVAPWFVNPIGSRLPAGPASVLGSRRGDATYSEHDRDVLQRSADSVTEALALAAHLGFRPLPRSQGTRRL